MVIKYRRPTSASRVGQDMRNTWSHVVGNLATLVRVRRGLVRHRLRQEHPPRVLRRDPAQLSLVPAGSPSARRAYRDDDGERREEGAAAAAARNRRQGSVARLPVRWTREVKRCVGLEKSNSKK